MNRKQEAYFSTKTWNAPFRLPLLTAYLSLSLSLNQKHTGHWLKRLSSHKLLKLFYLISFGTSGNSQNISVSSQGNHELLNPLNKRSDMWLARINPTWVYLVQYRCRVQVLSTEVIACRVAKIPAMAGQEPKNFGASEGSADGFHKLAWTPPPKFHPLHRERLCSIGGEPSYASYTYVYIYISTHTHT